MLCSLAMPSEYEALHRPAPAPVRRPASLNLSVTVPAVAAPRRPILVVRPGGAEDAVELEPTSASSSSAAAAPQQPQQQQQQEAEAAELASPTRHKKRVVFADDAGRQLTHVKVMTEPSFAPPRWSMAFLAQVTRGAAAEVCPEPWEPTFAQPASDYLSFRARLDRHNVSLENVIVREAEQVVVGTVKVKNLAFHKEVLVRSTSDGWATHEDAYCTYLASGAHAAGVPVLYDTFSFRLALPPQSRRLEFCVRFQCEHDGVPRDYWDSNGGNNYVLLRKCSPLNAAGLGGLGQQQHSAGLGLGMSVDELTAKIGDLTTRQDSLPRTVGSPYAHGDDALYAKVDTWSEFASWNHGPYW